MKTFGFIGFGELGRQIAGLVLPAERVAVKYFDDVLHGQNGPDAQPFSRWADDEFRDAAFFVCLGYKHLKKNSN